MKPRLYLFLSSLVSVLRIITFWLRNIPFHSLKILKFHSRRSARFQCVLITTPNKENTGSYFVPCSRKLKKTNKPIFWQSSKTWFLKFVWWCVYVQDKLCQKDWWMLLFVATAAAAQPQIAITHLHAKQEPIPSVANEPHTAERWG